MARHVPPQREGAPVQRAQRSSGGAGPVQGLFQNLVAAGQLGVFTHLDTVELDVRRAAAGDGGGDVVDDVADAAADRGEADAAVFRNGTWFINRSTAGQQIVTFGTAGDTPTPAAFLR